MNEITQIRKLSLWIFFIPLIAINLCLLISQNYKFLENTYFSVAQLGRWINANMHKISNFAMMKEIRVFKIQMLSMIRSAWHGAEILINFVFALSTCL